MEAKCSYNNILIAIGIQFLYKIEILINLKFKY